MLLTLVFTVGFTAFVFAALSLVLSRSPMARPNTRRTWSAAAERLSLSFVEHEEAALSNRPHLQRHIITGDHEGFTVSLSHTLSGHRYARASGVVELISAFPEALLLATRTLRENHDELATGDHLFDEHFVIHSDAWIPNARTRAALLALRDVTDSVALEGNKLTWTHTVAPSDPDDIQRIFQAATECARVIQDATITLPLSVPRFSEQIAKEKTQKRVQEHISVSA